MNTLYEKAVRGHVAVTAHAHEAGEAMGRRLDIRDERGDITPRTVGIAAMTGVAVAVTALIVAKITAKEATINLGP